MKLSKLITLSAVFDRFIECQENTNAGHLDKYSSGEILSWEIEMKKWKNAQSGNFFSNRKFL